MQNSRPVSELFLDAGDILFSEGDLVECGYIVVSGELILYSDANEERVNFERRGAGSIIGELSILTGRPRTVTVEALEPCRIYCISANQILHRFDKLDPVLRACIDASIEFNGRLTKGKMGTDSDVPLIPSALKNIDELIKQFRFEQDILAGLDRHEFSMVYQPIVQLGDSEMVGFESLMRWQHPDLGNIPPDRFIEVAETMGVICRLTDFALMESCAALKRLRTLDECQQDLFTSINISGQDLGRPEFFDFLVHVLDLNDLKPRHVKLEVTETALVANSEIVIKTLARLRELGIGISIDDFGTGYSNLAYLKELPLTSLKIDRAFASDVVQNPVSYSIVKMIVQLGHKLGITIIAEGLESKEDVQALRDIGCDFAQGYYFSKPISELALSDMIAPNKILRQSVG